jgi:pimeloyl-ACP methyl ester carboxylesterase
MQSSNQAKLIVLSESTVLGYRTRELSLKAPLIHPSSGPEATTTAPPWLGGRSVAIELFVREICAPAGVGVPAPLLIKKKPLLLFFNGGPGYPAIRPSNGAFPAWVTKSLKEFNLVLLDQRGTGRSTPINAQTLADIESPEVQAELFAQFRSDAIVQDAELIRKAYGVDKWSVLGQSYGGFIILKYLHDFPHSISSAFIVAGLPITLTLHQKLDRVNAADLVYRATYKRVIRRNQRYYERYPQDVLAVRRLVEYLDAEEVVLPRGGRLTGRRFRTLGLKFGFLGGYDQVHHLVEQAFVTSYGNLITGLTVPESTSPSGTASPPSSGGQEVSRNFLKAMEAEIPFEMNPIFAILHESIYCDGGPPSNWSAARMEKEFPEFHYTPLGKDHPSLQSGTPSSPPPVYFYGEMVFPWMFEDYPDLAPLKDTAELLAARAWPALYPKFDHAPVEPGPRVAALVLQDDMFVDAEYSIATADRLLPRDPPHATVWVTNEYDHGALTTNGEQVLERLFRSADGLLEPR